MMRCASWLDLGKHFIPVILFNYIFYKIKAHRSIKKTFPIICQVLMKHFEDFIPSWIRLVKFFFFFKGLSLSLKAMQADL